MHLPILYEDIICSEMRKEVREEYIKIQKNLCLFCKNSLSSKPSEKSLSFKLNKRLFPKNFFNYPLHIHHSHKTGLTIGVVHAICNGILWEYYGQ